MNEIIRRQGRRGKTTLLALQEAEIAKRLSETVCVLAQPHRRGDSSELRESALGRFVADNQCGVECLHGAQDYLITVARWRIAKGIRVPLWAIEEFGGPGGELDAKGEEAFQRRVMEWWADIRDCEASMKRVGIEAFRSANSLILAPLNSENYQVLAEMTPWVKKALHALAIQMGRFPY